MGQFASNTKANKDHLLAGSIKGDAYNVGVNSILGNSLYYSRIQNLITNSYKTEETYKRILELSETEEEIESFKERLYKQMYSHADNLLKIELLSLLSKVQALPQGSDFTLYCTCGDGNPCHGDIIIECINDIISKGYWDPYEDKPKEMSAGK